MHINIYICVFYLFPSLVDKHLKEKEDNHSGAFQDEWLKDALAEYVDFFPPVSTLLEKNVDNCVYGLGEFRDSTFAEMWEMYKAYRETKADRYKAAYSSSRRWVNLSVNTISSAKLKRFRAYILDKERVNITKQY